MAKGKRITKKSVQGTEDKPFVLPDAKPALEVDDDPWGEDGLTMKQRVFVKCYVGEAAGNATKAARMAGYRDDNYDNLRAAASETLTKPNVQRAIEREFGKRFGSPEDVRNSISAIARANAADYLRPDEGGKLRLNLEAMAEAGALGLIHQIDDEVLEAGGMATTIKRKLKLYDRLKALEILSKMNGQQIDRHQIEGSLKVTHAIKPAMAKLLGNPEAYARAKALAEVTRNSDN